jgi:hypothetical protein
MTGKITKRISRSLLRKLHYQRRAEERTEKPRTAKLDEHVDDAMVGGGIKPGKAKP